LLTAVCPALVTRASIVIVDTFATFFALVSLWFCLRIHGRTTKSVWRDTTLVGFATGLTLASKYPVAVVGIAVLITVLARRFPWLLFAAVLIALFLNSSFRPFRSFLSLVPLLCIAAALAFSSLIDWALPRKHIGSSLGAIIVLFCGCAGSLGFSSFQQAAQRM